MALGIKDLEQITVLIKKRRMIQELIDTTAIKISPNGGFSDFIGDHWLDEDLVAAVQSALANGLVKIDKMLEQFGVDVGKE